MKGNEVAMPRQAEKQAAASRVLTRYLPLILGGLTAIGPLSIDMYLPSLPLLANEFGVAASLAQMSLTACLLGLAVGQIFIGPFSDARGRRRPLLAGLLVFALASLGCVFVQSIEMFLFLRFVEGVSGSAGIVIARAIARDLYTGHDLTRFFAMLMLVNGVAPIAAPILGGQMIAVFPWRSVFVVLAMIAVVLLGAVFWRCAETLPLERRLKGDARTALNSFSALFKQRSFVGHCLVQCFAFSGLFSYISGSPFVLQNIYHVSPQTFSLIFAVNGAGLVIAGQLAGRLAGRISDLNIMQFGVCQAIAGSAALLAVIVLELPLWVFLIPLFVTVTSLSVVAASSFSLAMQKQGRIAGSAAALLGFFSNVSGGLMAPVVGLGGSYTALPMGIVICIGEIMAGLCFWWFVKNARESDCQARSL